MCSLMLDIQDQIYVQNDCYNDYTRMAYPQCVFFDALQDLIFLQNSWHNDYIEMISAQCVFIDA